MQKPLLFRRNIPFYYNKTEAQFRQDPYERYDPMVQRQIALHLADELWKDYPFQPILDWTKKQLKVSDNLKIAEIGCGLGRLVGELAMDMPQSQFWGIDYSYQMLRSAYEYWITGKSIELDCSMRGFPALLLQAYERSNLNFGLAKAEKLPFSDNFLDVVCSSFLLDRLDDPLQGLQEMHRSLKTNGQLVLVSPLNFQKAMHWQQFFPASKLIREIEEIGFKIEAQNKELIVREPLDAHGNCVQWNCLAISARKIGSLS